MKRLTDQELIAMYDGGNIDALWEEASREVAPIQHRLATLGWDCGDEDAAQTAYLALGEQLRRRGWKPALGAFTTWTRDVIEGALRDFARVKGNLGIGSAHQYAEGRPVSIVSLDYELVNENEEGEKTDTGTYMDKLTYEDTGYVPEGFGQPEDEDAREAQKGAVESILAGLSTKERDTLIALYLDGKTQAEVAASDGVSRQAVEMRAKRALDKAREQACVKLPKSSYRLPEAPLRFIRKVEGQPSQMYYLDPNEVVFTDGGPIVVKRKRRSFEFDSIQAGKGVAYVK